MKQYKTKAKKPLTEAQKQEIAKKKKDNLFKKKIRDTFVNMGFMYFPSANREFKIGHRLVELDYVFI